ncbi:MAG TPA: 30S ribosomal protein S7 [Syntrophorhabdaceae bacterium]|nr:30S ribosomal protein S7 [Syntrophorhabdaceae bacterium]
MPRKGHVSKREKLPDPKYNDLIVQRLVNCVMLDGKKSTATRIVYGAFDYIGEKTKEEPLKVFHKAMDNIKPEIEVKARRVGGATYQVPVEVRLNRKLSLGIRWLIRYARERSEKTMLERLAGEILDAFNNKGGAVKKREDTHKMAEANKAFAHYRW